MRLMGLYKPSKNKLACPLCLFYYFLKTIFLIHLLVVVLASAAMRGAMTMMVVVVVLVVLVATLEVFSQYFKLDVCKLLLI